MKTLWTTEQCPTCEGSGFDYCERCEGACEHDRACPTCRGYEEVATRLEGMALVAASFVGGVYYPTKRAADEAIRREKDGETVTITLAA